MSPLKATDGWCGSCSGPETSSGAPNALPSNGTAQMRSFAATATTALPPAEVARSPRPMSAKLWSGAIGAMACGVPMERPFTSAALMASEPEKTTMFGAVFTPTPPAMLFVAVGIELLRRREARSWPYGPSPTRSPWPPRPR